MLTVMYERQSFRIYWTRKCTSKNKNEQGSKQDLQMIGQAKTHIEPCHRYKSIWIEITLSRQQEQRLYERWETRKLERRRLKVRERRISKELTWHAGNFRNEQRPIEVMKDKNRRLFELSFCHKYNHFLDQVMKSVSNKNELRSKPRTTKSTNKCQLLRLFPTQRRNNNLRSNGDNRPRADCHVRTNTT